MKIFLKSGEGERLEMLPAVCLLTCPLVQVCSLSRASGPAGGWLWSSGGAFPAFCPLYGFTCGTLCLNVALFRVFRAFLARFMVVVWVCVALVVCVDCGAFVRVWS